MQWFWLDWLPSVYLWLLKWQSTAAVVFAGALAVAEGIPWNTVCPSFCLAVFLVVFLELDHYISLNFDMVLEKKALSSFAWKLDFL